MQQSSVVNLLKILSEAELQEFELFVGSPFFCRSAQAKEAAMLFALLKPYAPDYTGDALQRETIFARLFGDKAVGNSRLDKVMSELHKLIRTFLLTTEYFNRENEFEQALDFARILRKKGMESRYPLSMEHAAKLLKELKPGTSKFLFRQYLLEEEQHIWESFFNRKKGDVNIPQVLRKLDSFYFLKKADFLNQLSLQKKATQVEIAEQFEATLTFPNIPATYFEENPLLYIEAKIYSLLNAPNPDPEDFLNLLQWLSENETLIDPDTQYEFYAYLRNICTLLTNSGHTELLPVLHRIHRHNLEKGYLLFEGKLSPSAYKNVAVLAIRLNEVDWAMEFTEKYRHIVVGENDTSDFYHLNMANCYFAKKEWRKALDILPPSSAYNDYHSAAKTLEIKLYYELDDDLLQFKIDAFKMWVNRGAKKLLSPEKKEMLGNFINIVQQLCNSPENDKSRSEQLLKRIHAKKFLAERPWLLQKAKARAGRQVEISG